MRHWGSRVGKSHHNHRGEKVGWRKPPAAGLQGVHREAGRKTRKQGFTPEMTVLWEVVFESLLADRSSVPLGRRAKNVAMRTSEDVRRDGNPAAPGHPDDLQDCDLTDMAEKLIGAIYAEDTWVVPLGETRNYHRVADTTHLNEKQKQVDKWWGGSTARGTPRSPPVSEERLILDAGSEDPGCSLRRHAIDFNRRRYDASVTSGKISLARVEIQERYRCMRG